MGAPAAEPQVSLHCKFGHGCGPSQLLPLGHQCNRQACSQLFVCRSSKNVPLVIRPVNLVGERIVRWSHLDHFIVDHETATISFVHPAAARALHVDRDAPLLTDSMSLSSRDLCVLYDSSGRCAQCSHVQTGG